MKKEQQATVQEYEAKVSSATATLDEIAKAEKEAKYERAEGGKTEANIYTNENNKDKAVPIIILNVL